ncbi:uncharacterized protein Triagg1_9177 [Trichoderma aggressivum f. europaeum]|uniref:Peptidase S8/S53 domain-containing protein n=1 Tax=Trichoderma aggressivum f. europaeum TaxID=173218 RepID=A0AAE1IZE5_9HYPO|nr:hypothetical protein Triagg1_9177 [Trichoderma aggressivum f. europaeum]
MNHAIDNWNVDIISLSFGWPFTDFEHYNELEDAIDKAYSKKILIFAAASNSGGRLGRAYPASSSQAICVHSTDTWGTPSGFSPTAEPDNLNVATVGESIESAWPMLLCHDKITPHRDCGFPVTVRKAALTRESCISSQKKGKDGGIAEEMRQART